MPLFHTEGRGYIQQTASGGRIAVYKIMRGRARLTGQSCAHSLIITIHTLAVPYLLHTHCPLSFAHLLFTIICSVAISLCTPTVHCFAHSPFTTIFPLTVAYLLHASCSLDFAFHCVLPFAFSQFPLFCTLGVRRLSYAHFAHLVHSIFCALTVHYTLHTRCSLPFARSLFTPFTPSPRKRSTTCRSGSTRSNRKSRTWRKNQRSLCRKLRRRAST